MRGLNRAVLMIEPWLCLHCAFRLNSVPCIYIWIAQKRIWIKIKKKPESQKRSVEHRGNQWRRIAKSRQYEKANASAMLKIWEKSTCTAQQRLLHCHSDAQIWSASCGVSKDSGVSVKSALCFGAKEERNLQQWPTTTSWDLGKGTALLNQLCL